MKRAAEGVDWLEAGSGRRGLRRLGDNKRVVRPDQNAAPATPVLHSADKRNRAEGQAEGETEGGKQKRQHRNNTEKTAAGEMNHTGTPG